MSEELKPCPFCGGPAKHDKPTIVGNDAWLHIHCANRCSVAPSAHGSSVVWYWSTVHRKNVRAYSDEDAMQQATDLAYSRWNRRADVAVADANDAERALAAVTAERDRLREEVARLESAWHVETMNRKDGIIARQEQENDRVKAERDQLRAEVEGMRKDAVRWRYVRLQGDDTHWLNLLRVDLDEFGGNINAAVDALIDGEAPAMAAKEAAAK